MDSSTRAQAETSEHNEMKVAVVLPGVGYTADRPLLVWAAEILAEHGWHVEAVRWEVNEAAQQDPYGFTAHALEQAFAATPPASQRLIVAKSFGTMTIPWAERTQTPGIWLTPILTDPKIRRSLARTTKQDLLIGGSADDFWDGGRKSEAAGTFMEIPDANHSLLIPNNWRASLEAHAQIFARIEAFLINGLTA
jgi:hypothetical protein